MSRLARIGVGVAGVGALALGLSLLTRPFASLTTLLVLIVFGLLVTAATRLAQEPRPWPGVVWVPAAVYAAGALAVLLWPGSAVRAVVWIVGASLLIDGVVSVVSSVRDRGPGRLTGAVRGAAHVVLGLLAFAWPDVTTVVVAVVFGIKLAWTGLELVIGALRGRLRDDSAPRADLPWWRRSFSFVAAAATLAVALGLAAIGSKISDSAPEPDAFYAAPDDLPDDPGVLLRAEGFDRAVTSNAQARRILYTTTRDDGVPAVASALVVVPADLPDGPMPVIAWAHGTTGVAEGCAPSLLNDPFAAGAMPALDQAIDNGWAVVATDYIGLGTEGPHNYLVGQPAGRAVLDAVRAAHEVEGLHLGEQTVVWGHSQGGHAALWAGILADSYAPDDGVIGVAALAPASNLTGLVTSLDNVTGGSIFASYVLEGYDATYDDVRASDYVRGAAEVQVEEMATRCLSGPAALVNVLESLVQETSIFDKDPSAGPLGQRLAENIPAGPISAPLLLAQGETDELVVPEAQAEYAAQRCTLGGGPVDYRTYPDRDHVGVVADDSPLVPDLLAWTTARFADQPAESTC